MRDLYPEDPKKHWKPKLGRFLLGADARIDFGLFPAGRWLRELWERFSAFMDRFHVAGWRRWVFVEPLSEGATLGRRRARRHAGAGDPGVPRDLGRGLAEEVRARRHLPRPLRQRGRLARHQAQRLDPARRVSRPPDQGDARHRRPPLLRALRHRPVRHVPRADVERARRRRGAGRLLDHPAARQEPVPVERAHHRAQGQGSVPRDLAGDAAHQERDPEALSRPRLSRRRRVRRRRRGAVLLQQVGEGRHAVGEPRCWPACSRRRRASPRTSTCRPRARAPTSCSTTWSRPDS